MRKKHFIAWMLFLLGVFVVVTTVLADHLVRMRSAPRPVDTHGVKHGTCIVTEVTHTLSSATFVYLYPACAIEWEITVPDYYPLELSLGPATCYSVNFDDCYAAVSLQHEPAPVLLDTVSVVIFCAIVGWLGLCFCWGRISFKSRTHKPTRLPE